MTDIAYMKSVNRPSHPNAEFPKAHFSRCIKYPPVSARSPNYSCPRTCSWSTNYPAVYTIYNHTSPHTLQHFVMAGPGLTRAHTVPAIPTCFNRAKGMGLRRSVTTKPPAYINNIANSCTLFSLIVSISTDSPLPLLQLRPIARTSSSPRSDL